MSKDPHDDVEVRRSRRRVSSVGAYREGGRTIVSIPARFSRAQEREWVDRMLTRLAAKEQRRKPSNDQLMARAKELSEQYLNGLAVPTSVRWAKNQKQRWGSCTVDDATIRISTRVRGLPTWVLDYVLLHELAHLLHAGHGPQFWALLDPFERTERARGFLEGVSYAYDYPPSRDGKHKFSPPAVPPASSPDADSAADTEDDEVVVSDEADTTELGKSRTKK